MNRFVVNGKTYSAEQIRHPIEQRLKKSKNKLSKAILSQKLTDDDREPLYGTLVASIQEDPEARFLAEQRLERGLEFFPGCDAVLHIAEFLIDIYVKFRRKGNKE